MSRPSPSARSRPARRHHQRAQLGGRVWNRAGGGGIFLIASLVVAVALAVYVFRTVAGEWTYAMLGLIMGGTVGNGYERLVNGTVTDFINFHFWPVFNVADSAVTVGVVLLIASYALRKPTS